MTSFEDLTAELEAARLVAESADGSVRAVVDGQGTLLELHIADGALDGPHPEEVGPRIVEAVSAGRALAADENRKRFHSLMPSLFSANEEV